MNFSEFIKRLGAEPRSSDPEMLETRRSNPEFDRAAVEAEAFERKLEGALEIGVDEDALFDSLRSIPERARDYRPAWKSSRWMALAAGILVVAGAATIVLYRGARPVTMEEYVESHFRHDGYRFLEEAGGTFDRTEVNRIMARFDAQVGPELLGRVDFIKVCPTLHGDGAHMVISSATGKVTVIYMPQTEVQEPTLLRFDEMRARVVALDGGSAAIIGAGDPDFPAIETLLRGSISHLVGDA